MVFFLKNTYTNEKYLLKIIFKHLLFKNIFRITEFGTFDQTLGFEDQMSRRNIFKKNILKTKCFGTYDLQNQKS